MASRPPLPFCGVSGLFLAQAGVASDRKPILRESCITCPNGANKRVFFFLVDWVPCSAPTSSALYHVGIESFVDSRA